MPQREGPGRRAIIRTDDTIPADRRPARAGLLFSRRGWSTMSVRERGGPQKEADFEYDANIASESFLDGAFAELVKRYGDAETFLKEEGGVTEEELDAFRNRILV